VGAGVRVTARSCRVAGVDGQLVLLDAVIAGSALCRN